MAKKKLTIKPKTKLPKKGDGGKTVNTLEGDLYSKVLLNRNKGTEFVDRAYAMGQYPNQFGTQQEDFNSYATHLMQYGEDDNGQYYMSPSIFNPNNDAIKVPNQYADYISSQGYKNETGLSKKANGGKAPIKGTKEQARNYQDSLDLYNYSLKGGEYFRNVVEPLIKQGKTEEATKKWNGSNKGSFFTDTESEVTPMWNRLKKLNKEAPEAVRTGSKYDSMFGYNTFTKPVQPIIYQPEEKKITIDKNKPTYQDSLDRYNFGVRRNKEEGYINRTFTPEEYAKLRPDDYKKIIESDNIAPISYSYHPFSSGENYEGLYLSNYAKPVGTPQRPKEQPINIQSKDGLLESNPINLGDINPIPFEQGTFFSRERQNQELDSKQFGRKGKKDYFDKKTGKLLGTYGDGGKISLDEFRPKFSNSNQNIQQEILKQQTINNKGTKNNPISKPEVEIVAKKQLDPSKKAFGTVYPDTTPSSAEVASQIFSFIPEAFHTPSRLVNQVISKGKASYNSEISETLGFENNDPTDMWTGMRNFAVDNAADFVVPMEGFSNVGSKTIPKIGEAAKTGLREGVDLVHPVGRRLKQIEQEGVSQGLSTQAIKNRQMQEVGITSLQREGYFPGVSEILSEYFVPYSYDNAKKRLLDIPKKIIKGDTNTKRLADLDKVILDQGENTLAKPRYDAWRMYSGLPQKHGTFRMAETSPINHPSYTQNELSNLEKFSLNDERRLLTTLPNEYDNLRFMYNDEDLLNNVNYLKDELKNINTLQQKGIDFPQSDFTTTNVMGGHNRRFFDNKMEYNDVWDLDFNGIKVDNYYGKPFMSHGQLDYSLEAPKKTINTLLNRANYLERNINPVKGKTKYDFGNIKLKNYINLQDVKTTKKKLGGKVNTDWEIVQDDNEWELV